MADITACNQTDCADRLTCYRFTCDKNPWRQAYFAEDPRREDGFCKDYWPNRMETGKEPSGT